MYFSNLIQVVRRHFMFMYLLKVLMHKRLYTDVLRSLNVSLGSHRALGFKIK